MKINFLTIIKCQTGAKKNLDSIRQQPPQVPQSELQPEPQPTSKNKFSIVQTILLWTGIIGAVATIPVLRDYFSTTKEKYQKESFVTGELKPKKINNTSDNGYTVLDSKPISINTINRINDTFPSIKGIKIKNLDKNHAIDFTIGGTWMLLDIDYLYTGVQILLCNRSKIIFGLKDDRLYVSVEFKDLQKEETVGVVEFNRWKLYIPNMLDYDNDDDRLEVRDKQNNIIFSIKYECRPSGINHVLVSGYFISSHSVAIMASSRDSTKKMDTCILRSNVNWKQESQDRISKIPTVFPELH